MAAEEGDTGAINKGVLRQRIWDYIEDNDLAEFPRPVYRRIPNFKDANAAAERLKDLDVFRSAQCVKINPDKPQEHARFLTLEASKTLLVPTPRMKEGLFNRVVVPPGADKEQLRSLCNSQGMKENCESVGIAEKYQVDLVVLGSVAVSKSGVRIGKGEGFADLEFGIMSAAGAVDKNVVIVTTVHDCQVIDIPESLVEHHDVTVDYILTPTQLIECSLRRPKPSGIIWNILSPRKFNSIPILKELREAAEARGEDTTLGPDDDDEYEARIRSQNKRNTRRRPPMRRRGNDRRRGDDRRNDAGDNEKNDGGDHEERRIRRRRRDCPPGCRIFVGSIAKRTRVSDFKSVIRDQGVLPTRVVWRGARGFCFLEFEIADRIEDDIKVLSDITFNEIPLRPALALERDEMEPRGEVNGRDSYSDEEEDRRPPKNQRQRNYRSQRYRPRRRPNNRRQEEDSGDADMKADREQSKPIRRRRRRDCPPGCRIFVGGIARKTKVSDFKAKIRGEGVTPTRVVWRGDRGFCFLEFEVPDRIDDDIDVLSKISFRDVILRPEIAKDYDEMEGKEARERDVSQSED